jgi:hypothetical protein
MGLIGMATVFISKFNSKRNKAADYVDDEGLTKSNESRIEVGLRRLPHRGISP